MSILSKFLLSALLASAGAAQAQAVLSPAEIEGITGLKGIKEVPRDPGKGAGGAFNYADSTGKLVLLVMKEPMSTLKTWKDRYKKCEPAPELGPDGCVAKSDPPFGFMLGYAFFSKNNQAIWLQQMGNKPDDVRKPNIERPELIKLANLAYKNIK
ncbi:hypothetical protein [Undibacterium sp. TS12]|uniref:hypothetical protein n=1 Tax=Undibacterium sp. TS12 TaxID=2908202 RepID=UPI001F4C9116|nr:hypothetical protein [Undibacterium sp. TS12]MCH8620540.1 hypothetical protein [Undibacterium sp. TS12]